MKKLYYLIFLGLISAACSSCMKDSDVIPILASGGTIGSSSGSGTGTTTGGGTTIGGYMNYNAGGTAVSANIIQGTRQNIVAPNIIVMGGSLTNLNQTFSINATAPSAAGFTNGFSFVANASSYPSYLIGYTDSSGNGYTSQGDNTGVSVKFTSVSYTNGGTVTGTFSGSLTSSTGAKIQITNGTFSTTFYN